MNATIRTKMVGGFLGVMVLTLGISLFSLSRMSKLQDNVTEVGTTWLPALKALGETRAKLARLRVRQFRYMRDTKDTRAKTEQSIAQVLGEVDSGLKDYEKIGHGAEEQKAYAEFREAYQFYLTQHHQVEGLVRAEKNEDAEKLVTGPMKDSFDKAEKELQGLFDYQLKGGN